MFVSFHGFVRTLIEFLSMLCLQFFSRIGSNMSHFIHSWAVAEPGYQRCVVCVVKYMYFYKFSIIFCILSTCFAKNLCSQLTTQLRHGSATAPERCAILSTNVFGLIAYVTLPKAWCMLSSFSKSRQALPNFVFYPLRWPGRRPRLKCHPCWDTEWGCYRLPPAAIPRWEYNPT
jgi:hypothetical protein